MIIIITMLEWLLGIYVYYDCRLERDTAHTYAEAVLYHSVGPNALTKPNDDRGLCIVNPMNQVNQYAEIAGQYAEVGDFKETADRSGEYKNSNTSKVGCVHVLVSYS